MHNDCIPVDRSGAAAFGLGVTASVSPVAWMDSSLFEDREGGREAMKKLAPAIVAAEQLGAVERYRLSKPSKRETIIDLKRPATRGCVFKIRFKVLQDKRSSSIARKDLYESASHRCFGRDLGRLYVTSFSRNGWCSETSSIEGR
jgi:hypothetical protein